MEATIVLEVVGIAINVNIIEQLVILDRLLDSWLFLLRTFTWNIGNH